MLTLPATYTAGGVTTNNGASITGDPGATQEFTYSIAFTVPANTDIDSKSRQIIVTDHAGNAHTCTLTLAAGDAYLTVSQPSGDIPWDASSSVSTKTIAWNTGSGNIILDYTGVKDDTVTVSSSENNLYEARSQTLTFKTTDNQISRQVTVTQGMREPNFKTADGYWLLTADNKYFNVQEE